MSSPTAAVLNPRAAAPRSPAAMTVRYALLSAVSTIRNGRFLVFTAALPVAMYLLFNGLYGQQDAGDGSSLTAGSYLMISMACYGAIGGALNSGARIAIERQTGWNRQLRLSALPGSGYLIGKAFVSLLVAIPPIVLVFALGATVGKVHLGATTWVIAAVAIWLCTIPFALLGLAIGSLATPDSTQPISMLIYLGTSILGGLWVPIDQFSSFLQHVARFVPTYWIADIGRDAVDGSGLQLVGIAVLLGWTIVLGAIGVIAYRRSGDRV
ncbi:MAG: ABC transporter permease [Nakamurella sp.]